MINVLRGHIGRLHHWIDQRPTWWGVALVATVALAGQLLFLVVLPDHHRVNENADYVTFYEPVARAMLAGEAWVTPKGEPAVRYPPGYSLWLALIFGIAETLPGSEHGWLIASNVWLAMLGAIFHHLAARRMLSPSGAWWASALWLSYLPFLWLSKQPNSEMPFLVALFAACWCFWWAVDRESPILGTATGVLVATATLFRPVTLLLVVPMALVVLVHRAVTLRARSWLVVCLLVGHGLTLMPWELWAHAQTGRWLPVSSGGRLSLLDGLTLAAKPERDGPDVPADVKALMEHIQRERRSIRGPMDALRFMGEHASTTTQLKMLWVQASRSWYATESLRFESKLALFQIPYLVLTLWGLWTLWARGGRSRLVGIFILLATLYFWAMTIVVLSILRYMVPAMALLMMAAAHGITTRLLPARES